MKKNKISIENIMEFSPQELNELELLPFDLEIMNEIQAIPGSYTVWTPSIKQSKAYYCGPASVLQALYTAGVAGKVSGNTDSAKQSTLAKNDALGTDRDRGTWINLVPPVMNKYTGRYRKWVYETIDNTSSKKSTMQYFCRSNHAYNNAVIYLLKTGELSYYKGADFSHYVTGSGIYYDTSSVTDYSNIRIRVADPHYNNSYFGSHIEPFNKVHAGMTKYTRLVGPANFVY